MVQNIQKKLIFSKKNLNFFENAGWPAFPNAASVNLTSPKRTRKIIKNIVWLKIIQDDMFLKKYWDEKNIGTTRIMWPG